MEIYEIIGLVHLVFVFFWSVFVWFVSSTLMEINKYKQHTLLKKLEPVFAAFCICTLFHWCVPVFAILLKSIWLNFIPYIVLFVVTICAFALYKLKQFIVPLIIRLVNLSNT